MIIIIKYSPILKMSWCYFTLMNIHFFSQTPSMYSEIVQIPLPLDVIYHCSALDAFDCSGLHSRLVHYLKQTGIFSYCTQYHIQLHIGLSLHNRQLSLIANSINSSVITFRPKLKSYSLIRNTRSPCARLIANFLASLW